MDGNGRTARMRLPRIVHVTTAHRADDVRIFERECRSLAASGLYDVYLAAAGSIPAGSGVTLIPLAPAPASRVRRFSGGPRKAWALSRAVSADLWHFHDPELLPVALRLASAGRVVIWDAHEDYITQLANGSSKNWVPAPARRVVRLGTKAMLDAVDRRAAGVVAATPTIASRYLNSRTVVVGNEARLEDFAFCQPAFATRRVLFTGAPDPSQLFGEVVEAIQGLPDVSLAVAGREPTADAWAAAQRRLDGRLTHLGWLDRAGLAKAITASSLGLATYADVDAYSDAAPTKLFEFCAAGLPVVASPNSSNVRYLAESRGGFLAEAFNSDALARAISNALADQHAWLAASTRGREWSSHKGSWQSSEARLRDLYQEILGV